MRFVRTAESIFGLPAGFQRAEYLESSGTQYIDTGYKANNTTKVEIKTQGQTWTFGGRTSIAVGDALGICFNANLVALQFGSQSINYNQTGIAQQVSECVISQDGAYINGVLRASFTSETFSCPNNLYLFEINNNGSLGDGLKGKMWYCRILEGDTLVRYFIPALDPFGVACMYDLVGKKPYYNQGTGTFTVGRQVIPVEYLEGTGTQYIDTGYKPVPATTKFEFYFSPTTISGNYFLFGARPNTSIGGETCTTYFATGNIRQDWAGLGSYFTKTNVGDKALYSAYNNTVSLNNNSVTGTVVRSTDRSNYNFLLFTVNTAGTVDSRMFVGKVYYAKLWDNGTLVRDFIPCKDENNVGFMFDTLSGTVYLNAGTGAFSVGENKYTSKLRLIKDAIQLPDGYTRVEYLESSGTQYIDTGILPSEDLRTKVVQAFTGTDIARNSSIFGSNGYNVNNRYWINYDRHFEIGYGNFLATDVVVQPDEINTIDFNYIKNNSHYFSFNGIEYTATGTPNTEYSIILFGRVVSTQAPVLAHQRIYKVQFIRNGVLIGNFIPVRDSNNVGYMFDEVTGQLFGNAGSGSFGIGNDLPTAKVRFIQDVIPSAYLPLKYIESTGTQYIDTGVLANGEFDAKYKIFLPNVYTTNCIIAGARSSTQHLNFGQFETNGRFTLAYLGNYWVGSTSIPSNQYYDIEVSYKSGSQTCKLNGTSVTGASYTGTEALNMNIHLFKRNFYTYGDPTALFIGKLYYFQLWQNGTLVRDYYPALRKSDNKPGMYDRITKQFFVNQGTGEFNYEI